MLAGDSENRTEIQSGGKEGLGLLGSKIQGKGPGFCGLGMSSEHRTHREQGAGGD